MDFFKYHALGNDYIVIDPQETKIKLTSGNIRLICHRNFGIGSDGILYGPIFEEGKTHVRIYNPDGSEAEKSGNGIRIFAKYLFEHAYATENRFTLHTIGGEVKVEIMKEDASLIKVDMGQVTFKSDEIPVGGRSREVVNELLTIDQKPYRITCLSIGNPHCVVPLEEISEQLAREIGPTIENHPAFPNRINVQLMKVVDRRNILTEIWERGAGYTLASGSSSCAAASAGYRLGLLDRKSTVHMPGGKLEIEIDENNHVLMTGPVSSIAQGDFTEEMCSLMPQ